MLPVFNDILYMFKFFTIWNIVLIVFHRRLYKYVNLLYVSFITFCVGCYLSYVYPKYYLIKLNNQDYIIKGLQKLLTADVIHIGLIIFAWTHYGAYYNKRVDMSLLMSILLITLYTQAFNVDKMYNISYDHLFMVFCIANIIYFMLFA